MPATKKDINYQELQQELEVILGQMQLGELDIELATAAYMRGTAIIKELEKYLTTAENTVQNLKITFDKGA